MLPAALNPTHTKGRPSIQGVARLGLPGAIVGGRITAAKAGHIGKLRMRWKQRMRSQAPFAAAHAILLLKLFWKPWKALQQQQQQRQKQAEAMQAHKRQYYTDIHASHACIAKNGRLIPVANARKCYVKTCILVRLVRLDAQTKFLTNLLKYSRVFGIIY